MSQVHRAARFRHPFVAALQACAALSAANCGGFDKEECEALRPGMTLSEVEDEMGETEVCNQPHHGLTTCYVFESACGPFDDRECSCQQDFDVATGGLVSAEWYCYSCGADQ